MSYKDNYTINEAPNGNFMCVAVDKDFEFTKQYLIQMNGDEAGNCACFAGHKWCRHKKVLVAFRSKGLVGSRKYYNVDRNKWLEPPKGT